MLSNTLEVIRNAFILLGEYWYLVAISGVASVSLFYVLFHIVRRFINDVRKEGERWFGFVDELKYRLHDQRKVGYDEGEPTGVGEQHTFRTTSGVSEETIRRIREIWRERALEEARCRTSDRL